MKGKITITFVGGVTTAVDINVDGGAHDLELSNTWYDLKRWFTQDDRDYYSMRVADGSAVLLARDKILNIALTPVTCLEIK